MKTRSYIIAITMLLVGSLTGIARGQNSNTPPAPDTVRQAPPASQTQTPFLTPEEKRLQRKNLVVKEMNADANGKRQWLDHLTVWDENGFKIEEIEYAVYGQRERVTFEYDAQGRCIRENVYNDKNKLYRIRKYEYLENGRKKKQYNYNPDGKLYSTKIYEYSYK